MERIEQVYINGAFVTPHGTELITLRSPVTEEVITEVRLADEVDAEAAVTAAAAAFESWRHSTKEERLAVLRAMHAAMLKRESELAEAILIEYGAPVTPGGWMAASAAGNIADAIATLEAFPLTEKVGIAQVVNEPVGVVALITPWNNDAGFITNKLSTALAAGCTAVIKPSEMSARQTQVVMKALHEANLPAGLFNIVTGRGDVVGNALTADPRIAKVSFTGSTAVGKHLLANGANAIKRITLELGGKSPTIVLEDADFEAAVPLVMGAGFLNSGQACIAGTRILVPRARLAEFEEVMARHMKGFVAGDPSDPATMIGPMVSEQQWKRVQSYITLGLEEGARVVVGGPGRPDTTATGWFVRPTVFSDVTNDMRIAREEIFGPVLSIIAYDSQEEAIGIANDTNYGLNAVILGTDADNARKVAGAIESGRVLVNTLAHEAQAPFGGVKQSGLGREMGRWGLEAYLEPKTIVMA